MHASSNSSNHDSFQSLTPEDLERDSIREEQGAPKDGITLDYLLSRSYVFEGNEVGGNNEDNTADATQINDKLLADLLHGELDVDDFLLNENDDTNNNQEKDIESGYSAKRNLILEAIELRSRMEKAFKNHRSNIDIMNNNNNNNNIEESDFDDFEEEDDGRSSPSNSNSSSASSEGSFVTTDTAKGQCFSVQSSSTPKTKNTLTTISKKKCKATTTTTTQQLQKKKSMTQKAAAFFKQSTKMIKPTSFRHFTTTDIEKDDTTKYRKKNFIFYCFVVLAGLFAVSILFFLFLLYFFHSDVPLPFSFKYGQQLSPKTTSSIVLVDELTTAAPTAAPIMTDDSQNRGNLRFKKYTNINDNNNGVLVLIEES
mmetsp:Transcript_8556/g.9793  ORF Transcript_8556/g.9793 Transcript_8556/m.9793 type:complete len:369 (+) Transcript_8556:86-1192(+)|eukprot:CAMPEP_0194154686 /NCGR_PEP_ID=MMETSP0152-20130528/61533_1 /TAXON_ID=1049557 /ORGANISM="Thalassiothrix antarctica, Strain L6-D1" /LENGTH=368 /DNA_ID=CAMNT_0038860945 /DNA_START=79 /DNA_END=1185 /DNA_ORIENTATION=-